MAYSVSNLSSTYLARYTSDLPMLVGDARAGAYDLESVDLSDGSTVRWNSSGSLASAVESDTSDWWPTKNALGDDPMLWTSPTDPHDDDYLCCDLVGSDAFDVIAILGHNFGKLTVAGDGYVTVKVQVSNTNTFASTQTIAIFQLSVSNQHEANRRLVCATLGSASHGADASVTTAGVYSSVDYLRVWIHHGGDVAPEIGRLFIGRRYPLPHAPDRPWDSEQFEVSTVRTPAHGVTWTRERFAQRKLVNGSWLTDSNAYRDLFRNWFIDTQYGARTSLWVQSPYTALAEKTYLMRCQNRLVMENESRSNLRVSLSLAEVPPFALDEWTARRNPGSS